MARTGRPKKEFDKKTFIDLIAIGCEGDEICFMFRDPSGKPANIDTLSRWCKREFGMTFQDYKKQNGGMALKIKLRQNQLKLSEKSAAMAIWLGKQYLGQKDTAYTVEAQQVIAKADNSEPLVQIYLPDNGRDKPDADAAEEQADE